MTGVRNLSAKLWSGKEEEREGQISMNTKSTVIAVVAAAAFGTLSLIGASAQQSRPKPKSPVEAQLQELIDKQGIHELFMNYGRTLDSRDFAAFEKLFTRDAEYGGGRGMVKGPAAIRARLEAAIKGDPKASATPGRDWHIFFNETIEVHGNEATAISGGAFFVRGEGNKLESSSIATYHDHLVRDDDGIWKFKQRRLLSTWREPSDSETPVR